MAAARRLSWIFNSKIPSCLNPVLFPPCSFPEVVKIIRPCAIDLCQGTKSPMTACWYGRRPLQSYSNAAGRKKLPGSAVNPPTLISGCPLQSDGDAVRRGRSQTGTQSDGDAVRRGCSQSEKLRGATVNPQHVDDRLPSAVRWQGSQRRRATVS